MPQRRRVRVRPDIGDGKNAKNRPSGYNLIAITLSRSRKGGIMSNPKKTGLSDNSIAAVAYFTPFPAIFFLAIRRYNKRPYVRFHSWQSILFSAFVFIFGYILALVLPFARFLGPRVFWGVMCLVYLIGLAVFLMWLWCVVSALNGKRCRLPIIGDWADEEAYR
jgi:uncharacterized membrane protein